MRNLCRPAATPHAMPHIRGTRKQGALAACWKSRSHELPAGAAADDDEGVLLLSSTPILLAVMCGVVVT